MKPFSGRGGARTSPDRNKTIRRRASTRVGRGWCGSGRFRFRCRRHCRRSAAAPPPFHRQHRCGCGIGIDPLRCLEDGSRGGGRRFRIFGKELAVHQHSAAILILIWCVFRLIDNVAHLAAALQKAADRLRSRHSRVFAFLVVLERRDFISVQRYALPAAAHFASGGGLRHNHTSIWCEWVLAFGISARLEYARRQHAQRIGNRRVPQQS